ncbi:hypothetical protein WN55_10104 [Dufourea novaeangliae]|uniref:Uncharacterized protein n=1 Tax=Dufourea novaeangliae TaxID=178035 RepID=A0A154P2N0_DUFNO|nr:hypothetical protein WN55_10104 [Dufourea novaeangliae]
MNKNKKLVAKYDIRQGNKKIENTEEAPVKKSMKVDVGCESPKHSSDLRLSGHSTPIRKKNYAFDVEDSPELDYHCSPISLPCTQDGGNEIAWDWQVSVTKCSNDKSKCETTAVETPKRTKQLQKKRNSNSPLLQKPLKRKQVKMENIENIGKFTAELKALSERMKTMQQNGNSHSTVNDDDNQAEHETRLLLEADSESNDDIMLEIGVNNKSTINTISTNNNKKENYEDLFDDSVNDSMVKCSQEIEEKLKLNNSKGIGMELSTVNEEEELFSSEKEMQHLTISNTSTTNSKNSNIFKSSSSVNISSHLKTYSNNSSKMSSTSSISGSVSSSKDASTRKSHFNNNIPNTEIENNILQGKVMSQFPDDSFDDCLATCMEDDKVLSKLSEYDFSVSDSDCGLNYSRKFSKQTVTNTKDYKSVNHKETVQKTFIGNTALETRKFFKTKSLSDQYFYQSRNPSVSNKTNKTVASSEKRFQSNSIVSSVSTSFPITKDQRPYESNNIPSINGIENACILNRLEEKEVGNCIVKYKSTSNLGSIKETVKASHSVQCTPEEIERKRLEAKMRLEAKRKSQQNTGITGTPSEIPVKKSVKR